MSKRLPTLATIELCTLWCVEHGITPDRLKEVVALKQRGYRFEAIKPFLTETSCN